MFLPIELKYFLYNFFYGKWHIFTDNMKSLIKIKNQL